MQSLYGDDPGANGKWLESGYGGRAPNFGRQQTFDRITTNDNSRAHVGDQYNHNYYGPVQQSAAFGTPSIGGASTRRVTDDLRFDGMDMRRTTIKLAYGNTCQWFFASPEHRRWRHSSLLKEHHGFLWIRGKPGAGKSTLMRLAAKDADSRFSGDLKISFFFNAKGTLLERSVEGMHRSLLHQLLVQCVRLEKVFDKRPLHQSTWPIELLEEYFRDCVLRLGPEKLTCHIDALDECEESDVRDMIEFFEGLGDLAVSADVQLHVCFASRHYPHISMAKCVHMILDNLKGHQEDIEMYVRNNLKVPEPDIRDVFATEIRLRARDVFLWVVLVVRLLNKESDRGHIHSLRASLDAVPDGLHRLFEDAMLERGSGDNQYLLPTLLWILFAQQPLSPLALYHAVLCTSGNKIDPAVFKNIPSPSQIERFVLDASKGLAEVTKPQVSHEGPRVQFIHETVREYLQSSGICRLESSVCNNPIGISHDMLKTWCLEYMLRVAPLPRHRYDIGQFPFLGYAFTGLVFHAESAQTFGISQASFLETFPLDLVIKLSEIVGHNHSQKELLYNRSTTKPYIFACAPRLLQLELSRDEYSREPQQHMTATSDGTAHEGAAHSSSQGEWGHPLCAAIMAHSLDSVRHLLEHGFDVNARGAASVTMLEAAIRADNGSHIHEVQDHLDIFRLLLRYGADVNAQSPTIHGSATALHSAVRYGDLKLAKLLVSHGANINTTGPYGGNVLWTAKEFHDDHDDDREMIDFLTKERNRLLGVKTFL